MADSTLSLAHAAVETGFGHLRSSMGQDTQGSAARAFDRAGALALVSIADSLSTMAQLMEAEAGRRDRLGDRETSEASRG